VLQTAGIFTRLHPDKKGELSLEKEKQTYGQQSQDLLKMLLIKEHRPLCP
jgi:hypothetical protein